MDIAYFSKIMWDAYGFLVFLENYVGRLRLGVFVDENNLFRLAARIS